MIGQEQKFVAEEHPEGDKFQLMMLGVFLAIWITDSFIVRTTILASLGPWYLRTAAGALVVLAGLYLVDAAHKLVIDSGELRLIDWGVYSLSRHPMYLGIMLVYLGLAVSTVSTASLLILVGIFYVYDRIADYEEARILEVMGERYSEYRERTRRWLVV
ncbi:MAG: isoprenylcysteine carboxylmethyltransferase family protein [Candidatus Bathyarchaeota archaeon]|nr:isoprenylcysteine carboxylmethyltransferase family protein [Candidatus Bathyarchaeota archaeon]